MRISGMNHFTVLCNDLESTVGFYQKVLGLTTGFRPDLGFPGAWMYVDDHPILHIVADKPVSDLKTGVIDHMAFTGHDLPAFVDHLNRLGIQYQHRQQVESNIWQVFFFDPNGARVEVDFDPKEQMPS